MTSSGTSAHYALVQKGPPLQVEEQKNKPNLRQELSLIYSSYAELYPNPSLTDEYLERDRLLQSVKSALIAKQARPLEEPQRKGGFLTSLFGGTRQNKAPAPFAPDVDEDVYLVYSDIVADPYQEQDLCGTSDALQLDCIPEEAHSMARFHLCSHHRGSPVIVKGSPNPLLIIDIGIIAEHDGQQWIQCETSDKIHLEQYIPTLDDPYSLSHIRAVAVGNNFMAVSWGLGDGILVLYRRATGFSNANWQAFSCACPTMAVLENLQATGDVFLQNPDGSMSSQSLRVSDLCPLMVDLEEGRVAATLAVSRLGAYMELIPLSMPLWLGPVLTPKTHTPQKRPKSKRGVVQHYAVGLLFDICDQGGVAALTTMEHHSDIISLEAFRTAVKSDTEWDDSLYPDSPPAEYVLAATGTGNHQEVVTFWAISTIFSENPQHGFTLHVLLSDTLPMGTVGSDVSIFATDEITKHWRRPRYVELRQIDEIERILKTEETPIKRSKLSTLSASTPIVSMRFCVKDGHVLMSALDFNGGITLVDCTQIMSHASHLLSVAQLAEATRQKIPLTSIAISRSQISKQTGGSIVDADWTPSGGLLTASLLGKIQMITLKGNDIVNCVGIPTMLRSSKILSIRQDHFLIITKAGEGLTLCAIQKLDPITIIQQLTQAGKFKEAIAASINVAHHPGVADIVDLCHKRVWEDEHDIESLTLVSDDTFVIEQCMNLFENPKFQLREVNFDVGLQSCLVALKRLKNSPLTPSIQMGEISSVNIIKSRLVNFTIKLGTYKLLCEVYGAKATLEMFRDSFMVVSLVDLAKSIAAKGDIIALTILIYRHRDVLRASQLEILSLLPLAIDPAVYCHLFPVDRLEGDFFTSCEDQQIRSWPCMKVYMKELIGKDIVLGDEDEHFIAETVVKSLNEGLGTPSRLEMAYWYIDRASKLDAAVGKLDLLESFCALALKCLLVTSQPQCSDDPSIVKLYSLKLAANCLEKLTLDDSEPAPSASELLGMPLDRLFDTLLGSPHDPGDVAARFITLVQPIMCLRGESSGFNLHDVDERDECRDSIIASYCMGKINDCKKASTETLTSQGLSWRYALSVCLTIAKASKSSIKKQDRVLKNRKNVINLVVQVVYSSSEIMSMLPSGSRDIIGLLWEMYECLPNQLPDKEGSDDVMFGLNKQVDLLYRHLIAIDLISRWDPKTALQLASRLKVASDADADGRTQLGTELVVLMCQTFCKQLQQGGRGVTIDESFSSFQELVSDIELINLVCFDSSVALDKVFQNELFKNLLKHGRFHLMSKVLFKTSPWVKKEEVERTITAFLNEIILGDGTDVMISDDESLQLTIRCQDILGPNFPNLQTLFQSMRNYLDAAHFANSVLLCETNGFELKPTEIRDTPPLDIIEKVLKANPRSILAGCTDWDSSKFGIIMNAHIVHFYQDCSKSNVTHESQYLHESQHPPLPGGGILHLAQLVGLDNESLCRVVKTRIAHHGLSIEMPWITAALCLSLLHDHEKELETAVSSLVLGLVAQVVTNEVYDDNVTKKLLCEGVIGNLKFDVSTLNSDLISSICSAYTALESLTSRFLPEAWVQLQPEGNPVDHNRDQGPSFLAFRAATAVVNMVGQLDGDAQPCKVKGPAPRPIDRVYRNTMSGYNVDLHKLFSILRLKGSSSTCDDPLLIAIGRLMTFWAITVSSRLMPEKADGTREQADTLEVLQLCASLFFHVNDKKGFLPDINELCDIAEAQAARALEQASLHSNLTYVKPDLGIVRTLMGRGYTENGARRTAVMTNNESIDVALQWAVTHSLEGGFDDPIIFLKSQGEYNIDQKSIVMIREVLLIATRLVEGETIVSSLRPPVNSDSVLLDHIPYQEKCGSIDSHLIKTVTAHINDNHSTNGADASVKGDNTFKFTLPQEPVISTGLLKSTASGTHAIPDEKKVTSFAKTDLNPTLNLENVVVRAPQLKKEMLAPSKPAPEPKILNIHETIRAARAEEIMAHSLIPAYSSKEPNLDVPEPVPGLTPIKRNQMIAHVQAHVPGPVEVAKHSPCITSQSHSLKIKSNRSDQQRNLTVQSRPPNPNQAPALRAVPPKPQHPPPAPTLCDRSVLGQVEERARLHTKTFSAVIGSDERKRLVMKGRELLKKARETGLTTGNLTKQTSSGNQERKVSRYELRSKVLKIPAEPLRPSLLSPPKMETSPQKEGTKIGEDTAGVDEGSDGEGWDFDV